MRMLRLTLATLTTLAAAALSVLGQQQGTCKDPVVEKRLLADDVRYASPFYVIALPKNPRTVEMDNVCYTYYENNNKGFFHIMSITFKDGSNKFYTYTKEDIADKMGLAEAIAQSDSKCIFHDYTLTPICNATVFILYRCFIEGNCNNIDMGITPGVDVRVVLAANPKVSTECRLETEKSLKDTSVLDGGDYVILPQKLKPQCITRYNNTYSIGYQRAVGSKEVASGDLVDRSGFGDVKNPSQIKPAQSPLPSRPTQSTWNNQFTTARIPPPSAFNPYGTQAKGNVAFAQSQAHSYSSANPGYTPATGSTQQNSAAAWTQNNGQWNPGPAQWGGQPERAGEQHYHTWQAQAKTPVKNPNVHYHIHSWADPPPGCCRCN